MWDRFPYNDAGVRYGDMPTKKFIKRPVEIEAIQVRAWDANSVAHWCGGTVTRNENLHCIGIDIKTLEGTMHANLGDWIIRGINGEFYSCKPDIFSKSYQPVE